MFCFLSLSDKAERTLDLLGTYVRDRTGVCFSKSDLVNFILESYDHSKLISVFEKIDQIDSSN